LGSALTLLTLLPPLLSLFLFFLCCCHNRHLPVAPLLLSRPSCSAKLRGAPTARGLFVAFLPSRPLN
jgi:hypothetical protein